jgi:DNA mismatch endonuclease (patch repair protein)
MASIKRRDTGPELVLRRELWRRGLRGYKVDAKLPGRPDIYYSKYRLCIFVDGCFWHACPIHYKGVSRNAGYWNPKIESNVARDRAINAALASSGMTVMRFWDHEIAESLPTVAGKIERYLKRSYDGATASPSSDRGI